MPTLPKTKKNKDQIIAQIPLYRDPPGPIKMRFLIIPAPPYIKKPKQAKYIPMLLSEAQLLDPGTKPKNNATKKKKIIMPTNSQSVCSLLIRFYQITLR